jgi:muramidase (phage lysozyme)
MDQSPAAALLPTPLASQKRKRQPHEIIEISSDEEDDQSTHPRTRMRLTPKPRSTVEGTTSQLQERLAQRVSHGNSSFILC